MGMLGGNQFGGSNDGGGGGSASRGRTSTNNFLNPMDPGASMGTGAFGNSVNYNNIFSAIPAYDAGRWRDQNNANFGQMIAGDTGLIRNNLSNQQNRDQYGFDAQSRALDSQSLQNRFNQQNASLNLDLNNVGFDKERNGLRLQGNGLDRGKIGEDRGFAQRDLDMTLMGQMAQGVRQIRGNNSQATANGSMFAPMVGQRNKDTLFDTKLAGDKARLGFDQTISGLNNKEGHLGLDDKAIEISNRELDNQAAKIGLTRDQYRTTLDEGLAKLGLNGQISANQLMYQLAHGDLGNQDIMRRVMDEAMKTTQGQGLVGNRFITDGRAGSMLQGYAPY